MSYPGTLGGAGPISTSGNRNTSGWPLYITSCLSIRERWRTKSETKLHLCTLRIWRTLKLHKLDAQWCLFLRWFRNTDTEAEHRAANRTDSKNYFSTPNKIYIHLNERAVWWNIKPFFFFFFFYHWSYKHTLNIPSANSDSTKISMQQFCF